MTTNGFVPHVGSFSPSLHLASAAGCAHSVLRRVMVGPRWLAALTGLAFIKVARMCTFPTYFTPSKMLLFVTFVVLLVPKCIETWLKNALVMPMPMALETLNSYGSGAFFLHQLGRLSSFLTNLEVWREPSLWFLPTVEVEIRIISNLSAWDLWVEPIAP